MGKLKSKLMELYDIYRDACVENSDGNARARKSLLFTGYLGNITTSITSGIFFTAFMLALGASDVYIGYITMATSACTLIQFLSPLLWERVQRRKPLIVGWGFINLFLTYIGITLIPFMNATNDAKIIVYVVITIVTTLVNSLFSSASAAWTLPSLPFVKRVNYTSLSTLGATILNVVSAFLASLYLDGMEAGEQLIDGVSQTLLAIVILRLVAFVLQLAASIANAICVKEYPYEKPTDKKNGRGLRLLLSPVKDRQYMLTIIVPILHGLAAAIIGIFYNIHLVNNVNLPYTAISAVQFITTPVTIILTLVWTMVLRKKSWMKCLAVAYFGYSLAWFSNVFISNTSQHFFFIATVMGNLFVPCMTMVGGNIIYMKMPESNRTAYLSFFTVAQQVAVVIGGWIGTTFVKYTGGLSFTLFGVQICNLQLVSALAACVEIMIAIYTLYLSSKPAFARRI